MLSQPFVQHALLAGTAIAVLSGLVGYFVVLRAQVFAGDALSHVAFTGAVAALAAGVDLRLGLFTATVAVGVGLGLIGGRAGADDVVIGTTFSWLLGLGVLFLALARTGRAGGDATAGVSVLFGSIFGVSGGVARTAAVIAVALVALLVLIARPLLFASIDAPVAAARGVPVRLLGAVFLGLVGATAAEATQVVGALLLLGLLAAPAATAQLLTDRPWHGMVLSVAVGVLSVWLGIGLAYAVPAVPPSFAILAVTSAGYAGAGVVTARRSRGRARRLPVCE